MAAFILTVITTFLLAAAVWLSIGSRVSFSPDEAVNDIVNFLFYLGAALPIAFVLVFFGLGA
jgi:hypothetical protein